MQEIALSPYCEPGELILQHNFSGYIHLCQHDHGQVRYGVGCERLVKLCLPAKIHPYRNLECTSQCFVLEHCNTQRLKYPYKSHVCLSYNFHHQSICNRIHNQSSTCSQISRTSHRRRRYTKVPPRCNSKSNPHKISTCTTTETPTAAQSPAHPTSSRPMASSVVTTTTQTVVVTPTRLLRCSPSPSRTDTTAMVVNHRSSKSSPFRPCIPN